MQADAIEAVKELAVKAMTPQRLDAVEPDIARYVVNGVIEPIEIPHPPRLHFVGSLDDIIRLANRFAGDDEEGEIIPDADAPVVWVNDRAVVLVIDDSRRRNNTATFPLDLSDVFSNLMALRLGQPWYEPKPFVRLLRVTLAGTLDPVHLLSAVKSIRFDATTSTQAENNRTRESFGKSIAAEAKSPAEIPEEVTLFVPVYKTTGERDRYPVRCSVDVDPVQGKFQMVPLPDEIERVRSFALQSIADRLALGLPASVPHYFGMP